MWDDDVAESVFELQEYLEGWLGWHNYSTHEWRF